MSSRNKKSFGLLDTFFATSEADESSIMMPHRKLKISSGSEMDLEDLERLRNRHSNYSKFKELTDNDENSECVSSTNVVAKATKSDCVKSVVSVPGLRLDLTNSSSSSSNDTMLSPQYTADFEVVLSHPALKKLYHECLKKEHNENQLEFYEALKDLKPITSSESGGKMAALLNDIYAEYISTGSPKWLNLSSETRKTIDDVVSKQIGNKDNWILSMQPHEVFSGMIGGFLLEMKEDSFYRFQNSKEFKEFIKKYRNFNKEESSRLFHLVNEALKSPSSTRGGTSPFQFATTNTTGTPPSSATSCDSSPIPQLPNHSMRRRGETTAVSSTTTLKQIHVKDVTSRTVHLNVAVEAAFKNFMAENDPNTNEFELLDAMQEIVKLQPGIYGYLESVVKLTKALYVKFIDEPSNNKSSNNLCRSCDDKDVIVKNENSHGIVATGEDLSFRPVSLFYENGEYKSMKAELKEQIKYQDTWICTKEPRLYFRDKRRKLLAVILDSSFNKFKQTKIFLDMMKSEEMEQSHNSNNIHIPDEGPKTPLSGTDGTKTVNGSNRRKSIGSGSLLTSETATIDTTNKTTSVATDMSVATKRKSIGDSFQATLQTIFHKGNKE